MLEFTSDISKNHSRIHNLLECSRMCARNECPPDQRAYLCMHGAEDEQECIRCWENYLEYVANGRTDHPYQYDLNYQIKQESLKL